MKVGYENNVNRHSYKPEPTGTLHEVDAGVAAAERQAEGLLARQRGLRHQRLRIYADTSVIGGCEDEEFRESSRRLIGRCERGDVTLVISALALEELKGARQAIRDALLVLGTDQVEVISMTEEVEELADRYIESGALGEGMRADARHIAAATVAGVDVLAGWNFRRMVNLWKIRQYNAVNEGRGYPAIDIRSPEVFEHE